MELKRLSPTDWQTRLLQERAVIPYSLKDFLLTEEGHEGALQPLWAKMSSELAPSFIGSVRHNQNITIYRAAAFSYEYIDQNPLAHKTLDEVGVTDDFIKQIVFKIVGHDQYDFPFKLDALGHIKKILGMDQKSKMDSITSDSDDDESDDFFEVNRESIRKWVSDNQDFIIEAVNIVRFELYREEILDTIKSANELHRSGAVTKSIQQLEKLVELYPWSDLPLFELSIAYDQAGNFQQALAIIEKAIIAQPSDQYRWHSLSVILNHVNDKDGAILSMAINRMIAQK